MRRDPEIADVLAATNGDVSTKAWQPYFSSRLLTDVMAHLCAIGVARIDKVGSHRNHKRVLALPLAEAIEVARQHPYQKPRRNGWRNPPVPEKIVEVLFDPTGLFEPGAQFRAVEVFGVGNLFSRADIEQFVPAPDELPEGIEIVHNGIVMCNDPVRGLVVIGRLSS